MVTEKSGIKSFVIMFKGSNSTDQPVDVKGRSVNMDTSGRGRAVRFLIAAEVLEKIAFLAIASNLITYLTRQLHQGVGTSSINVYNWLGATFFLAILGGFLADAYWGRFWTTINFSCLYLLGMFVLTLVETIKALKPPPCKVKLGEKCPKERSKEVGFFCLALALVAISLSGTAPTRAPLSVDQFSENVPMELPMQLLFPKRWFISLGFSALVAQSVTIYIQDNIGWGLGFGLPTAGYALAVILMFCGIPYYWHYVPSGSPLTAIARVLMAAARNHNASIPVHNNPPFSDTMEMREPAKTCHFLKYPRSLTFLDRAAVTKASTVTEENTTSFQDSQPAKSLWKQCPLSQVEDVKQVVRLLPLWLVFIPVVAGQAQAVTFFALQGHTLESCIFKDYNFYVPPASLQCATTAAFLLCILMYAKVEERHVTPLQQIGVVRNHGMLDKPHQVVPMSILWLLPQYILMGVMEVFLTVGQLEFYYKETPECMCSLGIAFFLSNMGAGDFWASAMVKLVMAITGKNRH